MFDFTNEKKQMSGFKQIPPESILLMQVEVSEQDNPSSIHPATRLTNTGLIQLPFKFTPVRPPFEKSYLLENATLPAFMQQIQLTEGQQTNCSIGGSQIKAVIDSAKGLNPEDVSDQANSLRQLKDLYEMNGFVVPIKVKYEKGFYKGKESYFRKLDMIITPDMEEYKIVFNTEDILTDKEVPTLESNESSSQQGFQPPQQGFQPPQQGFNNQNQQPQQTQSFSQPNGFQAPQNNQQPSQNQQGFQPPQQAGNNQNQQQGQQNQQPNNLNVGWMNS